MSRPPWYGSCCARLDARETPFPGQSRCAGRAAIRELRIRLAPCRDVCRPLPLVAPRHVLAMTSASTSVVLAFKFHSADGDPAFSESANAASALPRSRVRSPRHLSSFAGLSTPSKTNMSHTPFSSNLNDVVHAVSFVRTTVAEIGGVRRCCTARAAVWRYGTTTVDASTAMVKDCPRPRNFAAKAGISTRGERARPPAVTGVPRMSRNAGAKSLAPTQTLRWLGVEFHRSAEDRVL